jgi:prevent-host-death family protein
LTRANRSPVVCATMCYMERIGIRELRQNASRYIERVKAGETLEVTERGRPVAVLAPLPKPTSGLDRLIAEGRVTPATGRIEDLPPPIKVDDPDISRKIREALDETRADRI